LTPHLYLYITFNFGISQNGDNYAGPIAQIPKPGQPNRFDPSIVGGVAGFNERGYALQIITTGIWLRGMDKSRQRGCNVPFLRESFLFSLQPH
jgi:hypothetical protein